MTDGTPDFNDFNQKIIEELRANHGVVGGPFEGTRVIPVVALTRV